MLAWCNACPPARTPTYIIRLNIDSSIYVGIGRHKSIARLSSATIPLTEARRRYRQTVRLARRTAPQRVRRWAKKLRCIGFPLEEAEGGPGVESRRRRNLAARVRLESGGVHRRIMK